MKKILVALQTNLESDAKIIVSIQELQESDNIKYKVFDVEELEEKQGYYVSYEYDKVQDKIIGKYIEIPKSEVELLREQVEANSKAVEDVIMGLQG